METVAKTKTVQPSTATEPTEEEIQRLIMFGFTRNGAISTLTDPEKIRAGDADGYDPFVDWAY